MIGDVALTRQEISRRYRETHKEIIAERKRLDRITNPEKFKERNHLSHAKRREAANAKAREWKANHREHLREYDKRKRQENPELVNRWNRVQWAKKMQDPRFVISKRIRLSILDRLRGTKKTEKTVDLLGCSIEELKAHLEAQFLPGMSWENHGYWGWHIDHKIPCASFDLTDPEQQRVCFHYSNLQPLWAADNMRKGARIA